MPFTPNQPLINLALVGLPGTKGWLHVVVQSQIEGENIDLLIPFQLAQCPLGYYDPPGASTVNEVKIKFCLKLLKLRPSWPVLDIVPLKTIYTLSLLVR